MRGVSLIPVTNSVFLWPFSERYETFRKRSKSNSQNRTDNESNPEILFFHLLFQVRVVTEVVVVLVTVAAIVVLVGDVDNQVVNSTITGCCSFVQAV